MADATVQRLRDCLTAALAPIELTIEDDSAKHAGHEGAKSGGGHYIVRMVSPHFSGLSRIARHRLVYDSVGPMMQREIHALALTLLAPDDRRGA